MPCQSPGLVDGVERDDIVCIRDVLVLSTPTHEEDSVQRRSPKTYSRRGKIAHLSPLSLRAIFHHLCKKLKNGTLNDILDFCNSNAPLCWTKRLLQTPLLLRSASATFKMYHLHIWNIYVRTELKHLAYTRAVFPTGVLISEVGKLHSQFINQRTSLPILLERS